MAFMRRCIIAVDLFGPTPKVLSTPRRQASEKLDVPAEVRPTQITEERFFRLLLRRVSSFFFARIRDRSENTGDTFFYFSFYKERTRGRVPSRELRENAEIHSSGITAAINTRKARK